MVRDASKKTIEALTAGVDARMVRAFFSGMDDDYFETFPPEAIASHIRMSASLGPNKRVDVHITAEPGRAEYTIVIAGFDYRSEFSIFCGLLTAFGLDIRSGDIFSLAPPGPRRIVDVFHVGSIADGFDAARQRDFAVELQTFAALLTAGSTDEARERMNRMLTERIEGMQGELRGLLAPIEITFEDAHAPRWTAMEVHSQDSFGFLYAVANALAMRGIDIHKARITSAGGEARDRFFIVDRSGNPIEGSADRERLRVAAAMMTQFTAFLPEAPDPARAMRHFDRFLDRAAEEDFPDHFLDFLADRRGMRLLASALGSSDFLWDDFLNLRFHDLLPILERLVREPYPLSPRDDSRASEGFRQELHAGMDRLSTLEARKEFLNRYKDTQVFWIDIRHLLDPEATLIPFSEALTDLAEAVVGEAARECYRDLARKRLAPTGAYAICGLGKFGGREMGYASDLELLVVYDAPVSAECADFFEAFTRAIINIIESRAKGIFRIDLRLRPYGDGGPLACSLEHLQRYYSPAGSAVPFERQALIKLRWVAGDESLGRRVEACRDAFTYSGRPWDRKDALHLRQRQTRELTKPGEINVKYGVGGIVDIEYRVQYLQLIHGGADPRLRCPNTLDALDRLRAANILSQSEHAALRDAYLFLRKLIDALRIVRGDASDLTLPEPASDEFKALARRLGYRGKSRNEAAARLMTDIRNQMVFSVTADRLPIPATE